MLTMENPIPGEFLLTLARFHKKIAHRHKVLLIFATLNISSFVFFSCPKSAGQVADFEAKEDLYLRKTANNCGIPLSPLI